MSMAHGAIIPGAVSSEPQQVRIVIADDHVLVRVALRRLLEAANFKVVGEASDDPEAVKLARELKPDILLLDLDMPNHPGLDALRELSVPTNASPVRVILLTAAAETRQIVEALRLGARGVVLKQSAALSLLGAVQTVMAGKIWVGPEIVLDRVNYLRTLQPAADKEREHKFRLLSKRELEVVQCLRQGLTNREIEDHLGLSQHTVKNHLFRIFDKLGVSSRVELLFLARDIPEPTAVRSSRTPKDADTAGFAVKKPGSEDIDAWIETNWEGPAAEPLFKSSLLGGSTHVALAIAVRVARDRWTDADDKRYSAAFKKMIFKWADEIGEISKALAGLKRALAGRKRNRKKVY